MNYTEFAVVDLSRYKQSSVRKRIEALFLDNLGKIVTRYDIMKVATNPVTHVTPENWHQRLSELRTDAGYTILSHRDVPELHTSQYVMPTANKAVRVNKRLSPTKSAWEQVLSRAKNTCEWEEGGVVCGLKEGDIDPIGGGTVHLTADHMRPHSLGDVRDRNDPNAWRALCGRHQVMKKNYWDNLTGKINTIAILQASSEKEKIEAYNFLKKYYGD